MPFLLQWWIEQKSCKFVYTRYLNFSIPEFSFEGLSVMNINEWNNFVYDLSFLNFYAFFSSACKEMKKVFIT